MVLIFALRGGLDNNTNVASNVPASTGPSPGFSPGPGVPNQGTGPGTTTPGTTTPGTGSPQGTGAAPGTGTTPSTATGGTPSNQTYLHAGFDTPDAAFEGYLQAINAKGTPALRSM